MTNFLERYRNGEHEQVWGEMLGYGDYIRQEPVFSDALAVARETMSRVRANIEQLHARLHEMGYQFRHPESAFVPAGSDARQHLDELEHLAGTLPLSLRTWYELIDTVDFTGSYPDHPEYFDLAPLPDPLVIDPLQDVLNNCRQWAAYHRQGEPLRNRIYCMPIAPDDYHKADIRGGPIYEIVMPTLAADALLLNCWHKTTFVDYLRISLRWGGFAGFEDPNSRPDDITSVITYLTEGLQPI